MPVRFHAIAINGEVFPVEDAYEEPSDSGPVHIVLLTLTPEQLTTLRRIHRTLQPALEVQAQRIGVDSNPFPAMWGGRNYWSRHEDGGAVTYRQIVRILPANTPITVGGPGLALMLDVEILTDSVITLTDRFEALVQTLTRSGIIGEALRDTLVGEFRSPALQNPEKLAEIMWQQRRVGDAATEFAHEKAQI